MAEHRHRRGCIRISACRAGAAQGTQARRSGMNTPGLRLLGAALIVLLGIWAGLKTHSIRSAHEVRGVAVPAGTASAPTPSDSSAPEAAMPHPIVPARLPDFSLKDLTGKSVPISAWSGKSLVINFWATWCAPCRREIPLLKALAAEWAGRDLQVVGIAVDNPDKVRDFAGQFKIDYPVLIGDQDALDVTAKFGMDSPAFPFTVFTDRRGRWWPCLSASCTGRRSISSYPRSKTSIRTALSSPKLGVP